MSGSIVRLPYTRSCPKAFMAPPDEKEHSCCLQRSRCQRKGNPTWSNLPLLSLLQQQSRGRERTEAA
jgi:hypothetical protein